jgi:hypothetical protein
MNIYPSNAHNDDKQIAKHLSKVLRPKVIPCKSESCQGRKTAHDANRPGKNGTLWVCRDCGAERTL